VDQPLGVQVGEDFPLIAVRPDVQVGDLGLWRAAAFGAQREPQSLAVAGRVIALERRVAPVVGERRLERVDDIRLLQVGHPDVPLHAVDQRRLGQVRGADVRRRSAVVATEQPRLGVQPGGPGLVRHLDVGTEFGEPVEGPLIGGA
jgi:hypothetical protein